jgi:hypothetical protein
MSFPSLKKSVKMTSLPGEAAQRGGRQAGRQAGMMGGQVSGWKVLRSSTDRKLNTHDQQAAAAAAAAGAAAAAAATARLTRK